MKPDLGCLSELAAKCLQSLAVDRHSIFDAQEERLRKENDVAIAMLAIKLARMEDRELSPLEHELVKRAEDYVESGVQPPASFKPIDGFGHRPHQTLVSLANGGAGHMAVTLKNRLLLDGLVVHHEHIDRSGVSGSIDFDVAPYRMIDIRQNGILRLHAADDVAVTVYCGRPNYQTPSGRSSADALTASSSFLFDPLTPIRNAAASASAAFANTVADVKFNLDGLTCQQAIEFMKQVKNATDKRNDQLLSSQFNLNRVLIDDRHDTVRRRGAPLEVSDPLAIAQLALELTVAGGWERVTLDSSSKKIPSTPLLDLINLRALSQWVHEAHSKGLETYISGGMNDQHVRLATLAGVDGVGIGFWCHRCNEASGALGEPDPFKIKLCLEARNESETSKRGIAARVVARLDKAFCGAQGNLDGPAQGLRQNLFEVLHSEKDHELDPLINEATRLSFFPW